MKLALFARDPLSHPHSGWWPTEQLVPSVQLGILPDDFMNDEVTFIDIRTASLLLLLINQLLES